MAYTSILVLLMRYLLGSVMVAYGTIKILQTQFILLPEVYDRQLKQLDGVTLTWAFLGFSPWFSTLLGICEVIPGLLLLFSRTKLLGAILLFPSLLVVFLVNIAYGFLPHMRIFTGALLFSDLLLLFPRYEFFAKFFRESLDQSSISVIEIAVNALILFLVAILVVYFLQ